MEAVGARLGRSSTRYLPATTFTGPVRKWHKAWVPLADAGASGKTSGGSSRGNRVVMLKWTPVNGAAGGADAEAAAATRRQRYVQASDEVLYSFKSAGGTELNVNLGFKDLDGDNEGNMSRGEQHETD